MYPAEGDRCLLCRQPLSQDAVNLIRSLWEFLASDATARFEVAQAACNAKIQELQRSTLSYFSEESGLRRTLNNGAHEVVVEVQREIDAFSARKSELISSLGKEELQNLTPLVPSRKDPISDLAKAWETEAASFANEDGQKKIEILESDLRELQHRRTLSEQLPAIKDHIKMKKWILRGRQSLGSTQHITSKHNELFKELVTDRFLESFQANLAEFNRNLKITFQMHGHKGETMREIVLDHDAFPCSYPVDSILSESEKRAVALADFLTEAALDESYTAIILDDPVNSFDLNSRKIIARKFAELALTRQVVIFTHDLVFLYHIRVQAKALSVGIVAHWIQRGPNGVPGLVFLENSPVCEGDYRSAVQARERYLKAKSAVPTEQQWLLAQGFGALRTSYEYFIVFELLNGVVERFEERISFGRLADVSPDREVVKEVIERMESVSRYIDAHLHSDSFAGEKPTPADLWAEIEAFEILRKKHKQSKKVVQQPVATAKPAAEPQTQAPKDQDVSVANVSREAIALDQRTRLISQLRNKN
jgi:wobble nucleotide-excising tRNase